MRIAMIGHKRVPSRSGGVEVVVAKLSECLTVQGHNVDIYNRHAGEEKVYEYKGAKVIEIPTFKNTKLNAMVYSFFATVRACFLPYDVIHFHAEGSCAMMPIARLFRKRCIATVHGLDWQRGKWGGFASRYIKFGEKMAVKFAQEIIVLSENTQKYFMEEYGRKTTFIPNGTEERKPVPVNIIRGKYGLERDGYILFLARITVEKGLHYLIEAFLRLKTDKKLVIAGALSPQTEYIGEIKEKAGEDGRIIFTDFVSGDTLSELFSNCFLYVLPSDMEGMPMSLLEAIGFRARCLVSDIPENTGVGAEYLHSFHAGDSSSLYKALKYIIDNEDKKDINFGKVQRPEELDAQLEKIIRKYNWDNIVRQTIALY